jgi:hypothetical protein
MRRLTPNRALCSVLSVAVCANGTVWLWACPVSRVATLVAVGATGATWANVAATGGGFRSPRRCANSARVPADAGCCQRGRWRDCARQPGFTFKACVHLFRAANPSSTVIRGRYPSSFLAFVPGHDHGGVAGEGRIAREME